MLQAIVQDTKREDSLANIWLATVCLLALAGFLRYNEVANIKPCDLRLSLSHVTIKILKSKTDQLRQGNEVVIARTGSETCPISMLEKYITRAKINLSSESYLFRPIVSSKVQRLRDTGQLTYSRLRELLKTKLEELSYPSTEFGVHSLRAGGAIAASGGVFQTDFLRSMAVGIQKPPKMVILRTLWNNVS